MELEIKLPLLIKDGFIGLKNWDNLEFTMLLECPIQFVGEAFEVEIPEQRDGSAKIDSFKIEDLIETERYKLWTWRDIY